MGALAIGSVLLFAAVIAAGLGGASRDMIPVWLGWGGAAFGSIGILIYLFDFWSSTVAGAAINPMRMTAVRYGVGLPVQVWMLAVGATLLRERRESASALPPQTRTPVPRRDPARPAASGTPFGGGGRGEGRGSGGDFGGPGGGPELGQPAAAARAQAPIPAPVSAPVSPPVSAPIPAPDGPLNARERAAASGLNLEPQLPPGTPEPPPLPPPIP
jgi:hypothetical protein